MEIRNLKAYVANMNMTLREFSKKLGYSYTYVSRVANGIYVPGPGLVKDMLAITEGVIKLEARTRKRDIDDEERERRRVFKREKRREKYLLEKQKKLEINLSNPIGE